MPVTPADKPLDALRDQTVDQLIMNYGHGELSLDAFQRRLDDAFDAADHETLLSLTRDLDLQTDSGYVARKRQELDFRYPGFADDPDDGTSDIEYVVDVFGGSDRGGAWRVPEEIRVFAIFGGSNVDFSEAVFTAPTTRVRLFCLFGGVDIYVPEGINTTVRAFSIFGGMSNKAPNAMRSGAPRLIVEGLIIFGGGDVKVRRTFKERLLEFADGLRAMFGKDTAGTRAPDGGHPPYER